MENPSHSRQPHHRSASAKTVGGGFLGKALYDDVYGGPPRFGLSSSTSASTTSLSPRLEDYSEIFGAFNASRASSIPVLELPSAAADDDEDNEVFFDVRSSGFDYSEVFGGFDGLDFAVAYDDLVKQKTDGGGDSSDEAWTPAESGSLSEESNHSPKKQSFSDGDPYYSFDGGMEFSLSYHKAHQERNMDSFNGMKHATQAPAPGYRFLRDEITPLQQTGNDYPTLHVTDDIKLNSISNAEMVNEKHFRKTVSLPTNGNSAGQVYGESQKPERGYGRNASCYYEPFVTVSDISLRTQSSHLPPPRRPPPIVDSNSGDSGRLSSNSNTNVSDSSTSDSSPPFFDVEVDASSSAAASAAAMKEAMEKARVQLKSAKELMERKKECFHSHSKSRSKKELKEEEGKVGKIVDRSGSMKYDIVHGTSEREDSGMKFSVSDERQTVLKKAGEVPEYLEDEIPFKAPEDFSQEKHAKGSWSSQGSFKIDEASEWQEATQYIELVAIDDTKKAFEQANEEKIVVNTRRHEHRQKERATIEVFEQQETDKKVRAVIEDHDPEELDKKCRGGWEERDARSNDAMEARRWKEHEKRVKVTREIVEKGPDEKGSRVVGKEPAEADKQRYRSEKSVKHDNLVEVQGKENEFKLENSRQLKDNEAKSKENARRLRREERHRETRGRECSENRKEALQQAEKERRLEEAFQQAENERRFKEEQVENEKKLKKARELQETEKKLKEALEREKINMQKEAAEREEEEKRQKDAREREENERRLKMAHACEEQYVIKKSKESRKEEGTEGRMKEAFRQAEIQNSLKEAEKTVKISDDREEMNVRNKTHKGTEWNETVLDLRSVKGTHLNMEGEATKVSTETYNWACDGNPKATQIARKHKESRERLKESQEVHSGERKTECKTSDTQPGPEVVEPASVSLDSDFNTSGLSQEDLGNGENQFRREDGNESLPINAKVKRAREEIRAEPKVNKRELGAFDTINVRVDEMFKATGMTQGRVEHGKSQFRNAYESIPLVSHVEEAGEAGTSIVEPQERLKSTSLKNFGYEPQKMECAQESKERRKDSKQVHAFSNEEENSVPELMKEFVENKRKTEAPHPAMADVNSRKSSQQVNAIPAPEWKDNNLYNNLKEDIKYGERETERLKRERELENDRLRKMEEERERERERELENDRLRKMEEEREREREREKDRMAVDRATLEAHEWASVEARGRAERAALERVTAEARQRAIAEARERLEKACAEAREKSLAGKAAMEARLKAERAAVERATAEARERAAEKLMASARNNGLRQCSSSSDLQNPGASRNFTVYERCEGAGGESAQRCKARLERHARTAERAAKALAEKNMRDLVAQKEQAERNRLAETLDADVKRWSSGKEGNLRALLSTLQYILGADSGWQPIPLTEVITAPAVKRAYRKATLCVHPDKLQQRGATIHQKYICEKVFDLLKEAWSKFNSEER